MKGVGTEPTDEERRLVRAFAGFGVPQDDIARHLNIDPKTLRKHFRDELDRGITEANAKVAQSLFQMATSGKNVAAAIFWMKARAHWKEKHEVEHQVRQSFVVHTGVPRSSLTDEQLERIATSGMDDDEAGQHARHAHCVVVAPHELTMAEWTAAYGSAARDEVTAAGTRDASAEG